MNRELVGRIIYDLVLLVSVLFFQWWIVVVMVCVGVVLYKQYFESIIAGILMDLLFGVFFIPVIFTFSFIFLYIVLGRLKKYIRFYG